MSKKTNKFEDQLNGLIVKGDRLHWAMLHECHGDEIEKLIPKDKGKQFLKNLPRFKVSYQTWYSESMSLVKQVLPDRLEDFTSYYKYSRVRQKVTADNYMIHDYLVGLQVHRGLEVVIDGKSTIPKFEQQLNIVRAAKETLGSALIDLTSILQADLFDSEIDSARALAKSGFLRAAGAICGVVIEKHLKQVCDTHRISIKMRNPTISDLNQNLKDGEIISTPQWRFIQRLADIRNICDHAKNKEPEKEEVDDLVSGTDKVLKTIF